MSQRLSRTRGGPGCRAQAVVPYLFKPPYRKGMVWSTVVLWHTSAHGAADPPVAQQEQSAGITLSAQCDSVVLASHHGRAREQP
eukprot:4254939-Pyramimonas_sp.AAC.1